MNDEVTIDAMYEIIEHFRNGSKTSRRSLGDKTPNKCEVRGRFGCKGDTSHAQNWRNHDVTDIGVETNGA